jgi:hypothetical protein
VARVGPPFESRPAPFDTSRAFAGPIGGIRFCPGRSGPDREHEWRKATGVEETAEQTTKSTVAEADDKLTPEEVEELKNVNLNDIDLSGFDVDPALVDEIEIVVRNTAEMICAEQPDVPQPEALRDLDSFSLVQILLELENQLKMKLLERVDAFEGATFRDLADFIVRLAYLDEIEKELAETMQQNKETSA